MARQPKEARRRDLPPAGRLLGGDELEPSGVGLPSVNEGRGRAGGQGKRSRVREPFGSQRLP